MRWCPEVLGIVCIFSAELLFSCSESYHNMLYSGISMLKRDVGKLEITNISEEKRHH